MPTRRAFLQQLSVAAAPFAFTSCASAAKPPNILFCISDDQSYPHAGAYGSRFVKTPAFDRVAAEGILFQNSFVSTPSCCPSRGSVLSGQDFYRLREASMNHTIWPIENDVPLYTDLLAEAGYHVGFSGKGWGPGNWQLSGREHSPSGPVYNDIKLDPPGEFISPIDYAANFENFLDERQEDAPFCFWAGFIEPHRELDDGIGVRNGIQLEDVEVPGFLPDAPEVRGDIADYAFEIEHFDSHLGRMLALLEERGELDNTIVVVTSDNGMAFPRAKASVYEYGAHMPLAIRWGARVAPGRTVDDFISHRDFAPTFLEAAGVSIPADMTGRSLMPILASKDSGQIDPSRDHAVFGIERHFPGSRPDGAGYPIRAIRTADYLYIRNIPPEATPVGDHPGPSWPASDTTGGFGDTDGGPTKTYIWEHRQDQPRYAEMAFAKRPAEELYSVHDDPLDMANRASDPELGGIKTKLSTQLDAYLTATADPRATGNAALLDSVMLKYPYLGTNNPTTEQSR
ncbi:MAG: sulfatase [Acidobacteria bacterium]|nr:sulfatase [Acidobacteriota bacterium]